MKKLRPCKEKSGVMCYKCPIEKSGSGKIKPRKGFDFKGGGWIQLSKDNIITYIVPYIPVKHPKWKFWRNTKSMLACSTNKGKLYLIDPERPTLTEVKSEVKYEKN